LATAACVSPCTFTVGGSCDATSETCVP
jgi:hypothetical protein